METILIPKHRMVVMRLSGEIDHHTASDIRIVLDSEIKRSGAINIALDFKEVTFMDSSGIGMIIGRFKIVTALGGNMIIYNASDQVKRILAMSGVQNLAIICGTLQEGIRYINGNKR